VRDCRARARAPGTATPKSRPHHEGSRRYSRATAQLHGSDIGATAGRYEHFQKMSYMDQCTCGAFRAQSARAPASRRRRVQSAELRLDNESEAGWPAKTQGRPVSGLQPIPGAKKTSRPATRSGTFARPRRTGGFWKRLPSKLSQLTPAMTTPPVLVRFPFARFTPNLRSGFPTGGFYARPRIPQRPT
jgi:hypothetical protein